ncbi:ABC transporter ATP-binding protein [Candidatus Protochlamydia phocaeensis]|uniref:ABC transporter ATP-binding protein n=1 Tax=Candidatus Protochlamydia phocaeensis TaxID=1414722 RepID=UPI0008399317|nr:ABC transporter ATP-binding protein [Candidatus Protochlamydia phocaeensis]
MLLIQTKKLTKIYKNGEHALIALNKIDLEINKGEVVALTGSSGSGKTTLMHLLGCLDNPSSGQFFLDGQEVSALSAKQLAFIRNQKIGFVFQNFHLLNDLNAIENIVLPQLYGGRTEKTARARAHELLEIVGLGHRCTHYPNQLSGGQRQRMAIARALAMDPAILLADEPTGNLDSENAHMIIDLFCEINQLKQTTIILVTHEKDIAQRAQRCITIHDGRILSDARKSEEATLYKKGLDRI